MTRIFKTPKSKQSDTARLIREVWDQEQHTVNPPNTPHDDFDDLIDLEPSLENLEPLKK